MLRHLGLNIGKARTLLVDLSDAAKQIRYDGIATVTHAKNRLKIAVAANDELLSNFGDESTWINEFQGEPRCMRDDTELLHFIVAMHQHIGHQFSDRSGSIRQDVLRARFAFETEGGIDVGNLEISSQIPQLAK